MSWTVPASFVARRDDPAQREWALSLGSVAARLAQVWALEPAGTPMSGYVSVVWPVRGPDGGAWVLKVGEDDPRMRAEGSVLRAWQGRGVVDVVRHDVETGALLLEALDPARDLDGEADIGAADEVIGRFIAGFAGVPAPAGVPAFHGDLHHRNVLHTRAGEPDPGWRVIDPLPSLGPPEVDVIAPLRNRWRDAVATGHPERALRRRLDQLVDVAGLDLALARALCQAVAVDNVSWIVLERPVAQDPFLEAYRVMATWY